MIVQLRQAAAGALSRGAPEDAVAYLTRALGEGSGRELRATLCFELGMAEQHAGKPAMIGHFRDAQRLSADRVLRNTAALELASVLALTGQWEEPIAVTEAALADLGDSAPDLALRLERVRAATAAYDPRLVDNFDKRLPELHEMVRTGGPAARLLALLLAAIAAARGRPGGEIVELVKQGWDEGRLEASGTDVLMLSQGLAALVQSRGAGIRGRSGREAPGQCAIQRLADRVPGRHQLPRLDRGAPRPAGQLPRGSSAPCSSQPASTSSTSSSPRCCGSPPM